jgi:hypothetical protein
MWDLIYKYTPRFMTGVCLITRLTQGKVHYLLVTGLVVIPKNQNQVLAVVTFFNVFGKVFFPRVKEVIRHS